MKKQSKIISNYLILVIISMSLLVIGVAGCPAQDGGKTNVSTTGLAMSFIENAPPTQMVAGQPFKIYVTLKNNGGNDLAPGKAQFFLDGVSSDFQGVTLSKSNSNNLGKKTPTMDGGSETLSFAENAVFTSKLANNFLPHFVITSCYDYSSSAETTICVGRGGKVCNITGEKIGATSNLAAPIQIASLKEEVIGNKLQVSFDIQNKGKGEVYSPDSDCSKIRAKDINEILKANMTRIAVTTETGFACNLLSTQAPFNSIQGMSGMAKIGKVICIKDIANEADHQTVINVKIEYKYRETIDKTLTILPNA